MAVRNSEERLSKGGVYLLETGLHLFLWVGANAQQELLSNIFGTPTFSQIDPNMVRHTHRLQLLTNHCLDFKCVGVLLSPKCVCCVPDASAGAGQPVLPETPRDHRLLQITTVTIHEGQTPLPLFVSVSLLFLPSVSFRLYFCLVRIQYCDQNSHVATV